jgi:Leucine-rich repeat (LRR) protein
VKGNRVTGIYFDYNNLTGTLPTTLGNLDSLQSIQFYYESNLSGTLPSQLQNLTQLQTLVVFYCGISLGGSIPSFIFSVTSLTNLTLVHAGLSGMIPAGLNGLTNLHQLTLSSNQFTNSADLSSLPLTHLDFSYNQLSVVPSFVTNLTNLQNLYLNDNQITTVPDLSGLTNLYALSFSDCPINTFPTSIVSLTNLNTLYISNCDLTTLPSLSNLTSLNILDISYNNLSSLASSNIESLTNMQYFYASGNSYTELPNLSGMFILYELDAENGQLTTPPILPLFFGDGTGLQRLNAKGHQAGLLGTQVAAFLQYVYLNSNQLTSLPDLTGQNGLSYFDASYNQITGSLPTWIGDLTNLYGLYLNNNSLSGDIPSQIGTLSNLNYLDLSNNQFSGTLPDLSGLTNLSELSLSYNSFSFDETIPSQIFTLTSLQYLDLEGLDITGTLPTGLATLTSLQSLDMSNNTVTTIPPALSALKSLSYLSISNNQLGRAGTIGLTNLPALQSLDVSGNQLTDSEWLELSALTSLTYLNLTSNQLTSVPTSIGRLTSLQTLYLSFNNISTISSALNNLTNLQGLSFYSNNLSLLELGTNTSLTFLDVRLNSLLTTVYVWTLPFPPAGVNAYKDEQTNWVLSLLLPIELSAFNGNYINGQVLLNWKTASEKNNLGFDIERSADKVTFTKIGFVKGSGTTTESKTYQFADNFNKIGIVYYRLKQTDYTGEISYSPTIEVHIGLPDKFMLSQNYPNPFNPTTRISFQLPRSVFVTLKVYDILGREVSTLVNENEAAGYYNLWFDASRFASGVYFYRLTAGTFNQTKKMLVVK